MAKSGIDWVQSLLYRAAPLAPTILLRHVLFGFNPDELLVVPRVFVYFRFRSVRPGAVSLLACLKSRLQFYLPSLFKRFVSRRRKRYFLRQWGANGVICSLRDNDLVFHL